MDLVAMIKKLSSFRGDYERVSDFRIFESDMGKVNYDDVRRKEDAGVTDLIVYFRNIYGIEEDHEPVSEKIDRFKRFADEVIART